MREVRNFAGRVEAKQHDGVDITHQLAGGANYVIRVQYRGNYRPLGILEQVLDLEALELDGCQALEES